jgi:GTP cyclohydrolase IB
MSTKSVPASDPKAMVDVQSAADHRNIAIDKVGVKNITYPITLYCPVTGGRVHTVASVNMYVALPHHQKGTHMSRFLEVLNRHHDSIRADQMIPICHDIKQRLQADHAHLELHFPYFIRKKAPVTGAPGMIDVQVSFECSSNTVDDFIMGLKVPATSLCPCSKEISAYGAHNQRCEIEARIRCGPRKYLWIEDLFAIVEKAASAQVFAVLKRPDEKWVTEAAFDNPKFVEDIVRDLAVVLEADSRIVWYEIQSENFESIHNHNAYAYLKRDKRTQEDV